MCVCVCVRVCVFVCVVIPGFRAGLPRAASGWCLQSHSHQQTHATGSSIVRRDHLGWGGKRLRGLHNCGKNNSDVFSRLLLLMHTVLLVECMRRRATGCLTCQDSQPLIQVALPQSPAIVGSKFRIGLLQPRHTRLLCMCLWFAWRRLSGGL